MSSNIMISSRMFPATVAVTLLVLTSLAQGQPDPCITAVNQLYTTCLQPASINLANFLWFVSNGTSSSGTAPSNPDQFKTQVCNAENQVAPCIYGQLSVLASTTCQTNQALLEVTAKYIFNYDLKCSDPCRFTVMNDLRKCYTNNGVSGDLFMSNKSSGAIIGSTQAEADNFCPKKNSLLTCLQNTINGCSEAAPLLAQADFNIQAYIKGVNILCSHVTDYLKGIECFRNPTTEVTACARKSQQAFTQIGAEGQKKKWTQDQYIGASCKITMDQVDCDLTAWLKKKHQSCTKGAIGLRREMECNLLPENCAVLQKPHFDQVCHQEKFFTNDREAKAGSNSG